MFPVGRKKSDFSLSVLERSVASLSLEQNPEATDDFVGPLGLNLLYAPPFPLIEFIFVHGLRGGSRKTWSYSSNPYQYWPKEWLPRDPEFKNVRIFSFGYNSDWGDKRESILNVHDFGKYLLSEIANSPDISQDGDTPIVFIGHSMGGIVIKKTCILAKQDPASRSLADRFKAIVFLATPHRGSKFATLLSYLLRIPGISSQKQFVGDLERNSGAIESTNDEFRHFAPDFHLQSFYESLKTTIGMSSVLIVDKDSATLGYSNEHSALLNADHRGICKFETPLDSNYMSLRNSLVRITRDFTERVMLNRHAQHRKEFEDLRNFLAVSEIPEDDLQSLEDLQHPGSCEWFTRKTRFQAWRDVHPNSRPNYWLTAHPGTGKSVMAAHIVRNLEAINADCSYYFFKHNNPAKSSLSGCLRSLAYQMAIIDIRIRQRLLRLKEDGCWFGEQNELSIWRKVFLAAVFEIRQERPHYFVIDALDECEHPNSFMTMLSKVPEDFPLRVFITSRPDAEIARHFLRLQDMFYMEEITIDEARRDIELYLNAHIQRLPLYDESIVQEVTQTIREKSRGSFLWVSLILDELQSALSGKDIWRVIEDVPQGMEPLYQRALNIMSASNRGKDIIKTVLRWTVCAIRPLTIPELEYALTFEHGQDALAVPLEQFISLTCGHLIHVEGKSGAVVARHETLRTFLSRPDLESEFAVKKSVGHGRITDLCLQYLSGDEMRPPRSPKMMTRHGHKIAKRSPFANYACLHFSQHLRRSHSGDAHRFKALCRFLMGNICSWIEHIARTGNIQHLMSTAKDLKGFLQARAKYSPPIDKNFQHVDRWETDLIRLVSQFGRNLSKSPSAIFWLIPPFCPPMTAIGSQFGSIPGGIEVAGLSASVWSDRISCIHFQDLQPRAVTTTDATFAVGLSDKTIKIFSRSTCQEQQQFKSSQPPKLLAYSSSGKFLAVATIDFIEMYQSDSGLRLWQKRLRQDCLTVVFVQKDRVLRLIDKGGNLLSLSVADGSKISVFALCDPIDPDESDSGFRRVFSSATISIESNLIAAVQRGRPIGLYDLTEGEFYGPCRREFEVDTQQTVDHAPLWIRSLVFSSLPEPSLLAALYHDGGIVVFDPYTTSVRAQTQTDSHHVLACSPDGRTLATGSGSGVLQIFEFETLNLIYKIIAFDHSIRSITFTTDSLRMLDIRGSQCNIWEPSVLIRMDPGEIDSVSETAPLEATVVGVSNNDEAKEITALACHVSGAYVFCGKEDGAVALYSTTTGKEVYVMYRHAQGIAIKALDSGSKSDLIVSADASSRFLVWRLVTLSGSLAVQGPILDSRITGHSITQLLFSQDEQYLLVSTLGSDNIYHLHNGHHSTITSQERDSSWKWAQHPRDCSSLIQITAESAHIHFWNKLSESYRSIQIRTESKITKEMVVKNVALCSDHSKLVIEFAGYRNQQTTSHFLIFSTSSLEDPTLESIQLLPSFSELAHHVEHLIGSIGKRLFFLNREMWICSLDLETFQGTYERHCCIPDEWFSANWNLILKITGKEEFIFVNKTEIAIIKRALNFREAVQVVDVS